MYSLRVKTQNTGHKIENREFFAEPEEKATWTAHTFQEKWAN
jgi:hypothetical protein